MKKIYDMLKKIQKNPQAYLGRPSIRRMHAFINGYTYCQQENGDVENSIMGFQKYIQDYYTVESTQSWAEIIYFFSIDEQDELKIFYQRLDEYMNKN